ncbi:WD40-repeat-containing domain protein [Tribonema minus]|uniref:WD40-repeat-containing domain protein n=1 Tax=Tribonema minus TaxID=303371 RepID=A0A835YN21_9STRA|nr:WD40-repeat-containing domain protein [Tribonema minus]
MVVSSEEINILVYRYLQESGFVHSAFTFAYESLVAKSAVDPRDVPTGALITYIQKGLAYSTIEDHLDDDGTERMCDEDYSLLTKHPAAPPQQQQHHDDMDVQMDGGGSSGSGGGGGAHQQHQQPPPPPPPPPAAAAAARLDTDVAPEDVALLTSHSSEVFMCAWNPAHDLLASGSGDSTARIWRMPPVGSGARGAEGSVVLKHSAEVGDKNKDVTTLEWNREGALLATGSYDGVARIWSKEGSLLHMLEAHEGPIFSLKWNNAGNYVLSGSSDKSAIVWDVAAGRVQQRFEFHEAPTLDVDWKDNVTFATCSTDKAINILAVGEAFPKQTFTGHTDEVNAIKWDPTGRLLASCSDDYTAKIWKPNSAKCVHDLREHTKEIYTIKWSPVAGKRMLLASASFDATVKLWDVEAGSVVSTLTRHEDPVYSVAFSPSGEYLASGSFAGHLYVWRVADGALVKSYQGEGDIFEVAWNHREDRVAACFSTSTVAVVDLRL